jgi:hypothetical protein
VDLEEEDIDEVTPEVVTKRMVWRVAQAQYDPSGLVSPFMIQFKLVMRGLCSEGSSHAFPPTKYLCCSLLFFLQNFFDFRD